MKLKYELEFVQVGGEWTCVPLDDEQGNSFHGVLNINETAKTMLDALVHAASLEDALAELRTIYADDSPEEVKTEFDALVEQLREIGLLEV